MADDFDHKAWINRTLESIANDTDSEAAISSILLSVQKMLEVCCFLPPCLFSSTCWFFSRMSCGDNSVCAQTFVPVKKFFLFNLDCKPRGGDYLS